MKHVKSYHVPESKAVLTPAPLTTLFRVSVYLQPDQLGTVENEKMGIYHLMFDMLIYENLIRM